MLGIKGQKRLGKSGAKIPKGGGGTFEIMREEKGLAKGCQRNSNQAADTEKKNRRGRARSY